MSYDFKKIETKWQNFWKVNQTFKTRSNIKFPKYYVLDMFPYPSGAGLHVGHPLGYIATDILARYKRHKNYNVLHPQGYDSFGLPAEQYAIQTGQHPQKTTEVNIKRYREQLDKMGFSFDWSREIRTSKSNYYKWTQWIFLNLFESYYDIKKDKALPISNLTDCFKKNGTRDLSASSNSKTLKFSGVEWNSFTHAKKEKILLDYRLAYLSETQVNWCAKLGTVLANEEIINGVSERGGYSVEKKKMKQWSMRIGAYSERLINDLDKVDWPDSLKEMQKNWIGKSKGASINFKIKMSSYQIEVFTTRPDTLFGVTFMVLAPENEIVLKITSKSQLEVVKAYIKSSSKRSEKDRLSETKKISGVFTGAYAIHPINGDEIPVWIGDYVLAGYGTGAVMAVPCGDQRDHDFAKHFSIPIKNIFLNIDISSKAYSEKSNFKLKNSEFLNGLDYKKSFEKIISHIEKKGFGNEKINYRMRDAVFSRQRYWGEPIPIYYKNGIPTSIGKKNLPLKLPQVENYLPTSDGSPPLGNAKKWAWNVIDEKVVSKELIDNESVFPLELNTMPGWAGSSWYFYRYMDPHNNEFFVGNEAVNYWREVDLYVGGSEHATGHLLYSRFWQKFLFDLDLLPVDEFAKKLINQGMILGSSAFIFRKSGTNNFYSKNLINNFKTDAIRIDVSILNSYDEVNIDALKKWQPQFNEANFILEEDKFYASREVEKMSKSKYNVINPDEICERYGADTLRMYEMFLGPLEQAKPWSMSGISGVHSFLNKLWRLYHPNNVFSVKDDEPQNESFKTLHKTIKKITEDINNYSFNTCVSAFMICVNELSLQKCNHRIILEPLTILLSPFAPHISEELWSLLGKKPSLIYEKYPTFDSSFLMESIKNYPISFNGKMRFRLDIDLDLTSKEIKNIVLNDSRTLKYIGGKTIKKIIVVPEKIINIVF
ncbi:MAG: leucine--tRNA ligase [Flavobacteriales bacterium]|nr:leucine--tRNA ligase [Flavobacteriales bacterium]